MSVIYPPLHLTAAERKALARYLRLCLGTIEHVNERPMERLVRAARRKIAGRRA